MTFLVSSRSMETVTTEVVESATEGVALSVGDGGSVNSELPDGNSLDMVLPGLEGVGLESIRSQQLTNIAQTCINYEKMTNLEC